MPHAVGEYSLQEQKDDDEIARLLNNDGSQPGQALDFVNRDLELGEKADDALDFEDISDNDLASDDDGDGIAASPKGANGHEHSDDRDAQQDDDGPNDLDMDDDLFGDEGSLSPVEDRKEAGFRTSLALPIKGQIALPGTSSKTLPGSNGIVQSPTTYQNGMSNGVPAAQQPTSSVTPELEEDEGEESDDDWAAQRALFAAANKEREERARRGNSYEPPPAPETAMDLFYSIWPTYEPDKTPRFTELFPPRRGYYGWKTPLKPPKPLNPTKVDLEMMPDAERAFRTATSATAVKAGRPADGEARGVIVITDRQADEDQSDDDIAFDEVDENEKIGGVSWQDITVLCEDWDISSLKSSDSPTQQVDSAVSGFDGWDRDADVPPAKRRKLSFDIKTASALNHECPPLDDPEYTTSRIAGRAVVDMNDPSILIEESVSKANNKALRRPLGDMGREAKVALARDLDRRYNISNDEAYELLKENHQHKIRSTLGGVAIDHSLPAVKLQYPFYKVKLEPRQLRSFHRPQLTGLKLGRDIRFSKPKTIKRKHLRGKETHEILAKAEDLSMGDNSSGILLEYSEELPVMLSNFGMGSRLVNYYRRKDEHDTARPKEEIGETQILLPQDRSPFANFGQVDPGELVPAIHNGLYRAPVFKHAGKPTDFLIVSSSTSEGGSKYYLRNIENLHAVGQQFPSIEVPGEHSRRVTDASRRRLQTISYRVWRKWSERRGPPLTNAVVLAHLPGSEVAQNRGKMRDFMQYQKVDGYWEPKTEVPEDYLRVSIKPEEICALDSMQVGVQHLNDLGFRKDDVAKDDEDVKEGANIELQLAPWSTTKNFMHATHGKAMLRLHGEGEPTGRGEGFSFIKTSMKGGFRAPGESIEEKLEARRLKENNGHSYNVARQQKAYDESIRRIWRAQQDSLSSVVEHSDTEGDVDDEAESFVERRGTPRSSFGTPAAFARHEDESVSQFSRSSAHQKNRTLVITRTVRNKYGEIEEVPVTITNQRVISAYKRAKFSEQSKGIDPMNIQLTGDQEYDDMQRRKVAEELARLERNMDRREARERAKGIMRSPSLASAAGDGDGADVNTPASGKKPRGKKNTEGTGRRCANCGQVGHIKTNKKLCPMLNGTMKPEDAHTGFGSGAASGDVGGGNAGGGGNGGGDGDGDGDGAGSAFGFVPATPSSAT